MKMNKHYNELKRQLLVCGHCPKVAAYPGSTSGKRRSSVVASAM